MIEMLTAILRTTVERRYRDFRFGVAVSTAVVSLGAISLGFATAAAFSLLRSVTGTVAAETILAGAYAGTAVLVAAVQMLRRRASRRPNVTASSRATSGTDDIPQIQPGQAAAVGSEAPLMQALKLGSELSTMQLLAVALLGGIVAGRNFRK